MIGKRKGPVAALALAPFLWVALEYIRSNAAFLALPWGLLAHAQYQSAHVLQLAAFTGAYGISFLVVTANAAVAAALHPVVERLTRKDPSVWTGTPKTGRLILVAAGPLLITAALVYGRVVLSAPIDGTGVKIAVVQGNIAQSEKWDPQHAPAIIERYFELTRAAAKQEPDLIVWPENATPTAINLDVALKNKITTLAKAIKTPLLIGSSQAQKFKLDDPKKAKYFNSAFFISAESLLPDPPRYDKIRLLPFGEYLPLRNRLPWDLLGIPDKRAFVPGKTIKLFELRGMRFGTTICWENIFPDMVRRLVKEGAQLVVNITNEAWFGKTAAPYQFLSMNVMRAVENRVAVVRCANTGVSGFIDPFGRIVERVRDGKGDDLFVTGVLCRTVAPSNFRTVYRRYGDIFAWICFAVSSGAGLLALIPGTSHRN